MKEAFFVTDFVISWEMLCEVLPNKKAESPDNKDFQLCSEIGS
jgi:hypothetical protein